MRYVLEPLPGLTFLLVHVSELALWLQVTRPGRRGVKYYSSDLSNACASESVGTVEAVPFDVGTAIALAGCAFESYNEPVGVSQAYKEWCARLFTARESHACACA